MQVRLSYDIWSQTYDALTDAYKRISKQPLEEDLKAIQDRLYFNDPVSRAISFSFDEEEPDEVFSSPGAKMALVRFEGRRGRSFHITDSGVEIIRAYDRMVEAMMSDRMRGVWHAPEVYIVKPMAFILPVFKTEVLVAHDE